RLVKEAGITAGTAEKLWSDVDEEFFLRERASVIARCTEAIYNAGDTDTPVIAIDEAGLEETVATRIFIHTKGRSNVFPITAATLDQLRLNIQDARLHTASNAH